MKPKYIQKSILKKNGMTPEIHLMFFIISQDMKKSGPSTSKEKTTAFTRLCLALRLGLLALAC